MRGMVVFQRTGNSTSNTQVSSLIPRVSARKGVRTDSLDKRSRTVRSRAVNVRQRCDGVLRPCSQSLGKDPKLDHKEGNRGLVPRCSGHTVEPRRAEPEREWRDIAPLRMRPSMARRRFDVPGSESRRRSMRGCARLIGSTTNSSTKAFPAVAHPEIFGSYRAQSSMSYKV